MAKQIEDIIPNERKSIRNIPIPESRRKNLNLIDNQFTPPERSPLPMNEETPNRIFERPVYERPKEIVSDIHPVEPPAPTPIPKVVIPEHRDFSPTVLRKRRPNKSILIGIVLAIIILSLGVFSLFSGATVSYTPKSQALSFKGDTFTAKKAGAPGDLLFSVIKLSEEKSVEAPASGEVEVSDKASGTIIVYNNASAASQRLIKNTRFETPEGKVYRITNDITVPGQKIVAGKTQPGSLEVTVYADQPGESYNIGLTDFTLPGLKGDPRFKTIYARSKTPMTGGMIGKVKKVSAEDKKTAEANLETELKKGLIDEASAQVPEDFVLLSNLTQINYEKLPDGPSSGDKAVVRQKGNFAGIIMKKADLVKYLASKKTTVSPNDVMDADLGALNINFIESPKGDLALEDSITFNATGDIMALWISDEQAIASALAGKKKSELKQILNNYPSIIEADAVVRPFWKRSFPGEANKIKFIKEIK